MSDIFALRGLWYVLGQCAPTVFPRWAVSDSRVVGPFTSLVVTKRSLAPYGEVCCWLRRFSEVMGTPSDGFIRLRLLVRLKGPWGGHPFPWKFGGATRPLPSPLK